MLVQETNVDVKKKLGSQSTPSKMTRYRWTICGLVFFATTLNYLDRAVIS